MNLCEIFGRSKERNNRLDHRGGQDLNSDPGVYFLLSSTLNKTLKHGISLPAGHTNSLV